ncbi:MAG TPA: hypothetical protein VI146_02945 [Nitrososphaeraceae archaeon]
MPEEIFTSTFTSQVFTVSQILDIAVAFFLASLSITAYRNNGLKKIRYAIAAFSLFAIQHIISYIDSNIMDIMPDDVRQALFSVITLSIMAMFFLAIVRK